MADFKIALKITGGNEGGYANNKSDHGGETYAGIARNYWGGWHGWGIVDETKKATTSVASLNQSLRGNSVLQGYVDYFYEQNFWDANSLSQINDQQIANNCYDCGVNSGVGIAAEFLQKAACVPADRKVGPKTIAAVNSEDAKTIYESINAQREARYRQEATEPGQGQFLHSWLSRLIDYVE